MAVLSGVSSIRSSLAQALAQYLGWHSSELPLVDASGPLSSASSGTDQEERDATEEDVVIAAGSWQDVLPLVKAFRPSIVASASAPPPK